MNHKEFDEIVDYACDHIKTVLQSKGEEYSKPNGDRLEQFHRAAEILGCTPERALFCFATKHLSSIIGWLDDPQSVPVASWNEKVFDSINYLILLFALLVDRGKADKHG